MNTVMTAESTSKSRKIKSDFVAMESFAPLPCSSVSKALVRS